MARTHIDWRKPILIVFGVLAVASVAIGSQYLGLDIGRFFAAEPEGLSESGRVTVKGTKLMLNRKLWFSKGANWIGGRYVTNWPLNAAGDESHGNMVYLDAERWDPVALDKELFQLHEMLDINTLRMNGPPQGMDAQGNWKPGYEQRFKEFTRLAYKNGMRIHWVLFFGHPQYYCPQPKGDPIPCSVRGKTDIGGATLMLPGSDEERRTLAQTRTFVQSLRNEPGTLSYEVGNEMMLNFTVYSPGYQTQLLSYITRIINEARRNDPDHFIVSGEAASVGLPWVNGKSVEFVKFEDIHKLNGGQPFSLYDVVDVLGLHLYAAPQDIGPMLDTYLAAGGTKPILLGEYGAANNHITLPNFTEQGRWHAATLTEARRRLAGAWVWNPVLTIDMKPGTYTVESVNGRPRVLFSNGRRVRPLSLGQTIFKYQDNPLNPLGMTPASLALANRQATFVSQNVPATMQAGQQYQVTMTWRNDGEGSWDFAGSPGSYGYAFRIKSAAPYDNMNFGINYVPLQQVPVRPGNNATFTFTVTAPTKPGTYTFQWQMNQGLVGWFGQSSTAVAVRVTDAPVVQPTRSDTMKSGTNRTESDTTNTKKGSAGTSDTK